MLSVASHTVSDETAAFQDPQISAWTRHPNSKGDRLCERMGAKPSRLFNDDSVDALYCEGPLCHVHWQLKESDVTACHSRNAADFQSEGEADSRSEDAAYTGSQDAA